MAKWTWTDTDSDYACAERRAARWRARGAEVKVGARVIETATGRMEVWDVRISMMTDMMTDDEI